MTRTFEDKPAVRENTPLLIGLVGPTGSGKTGSALELATGMQDVLGGDIGVIDSEARRSLAYANAPMFSEPSRTFKFRFLDFKAPFSPGDYRSACQHFIDKGVKNIVVDSTSHMWEGPGGVHDMHAAEVERLKLAWNVSGDKANFPAWNAAKKPQTDFINWMKQQPVNFIFCFRAKEKMKMINNRPVEIGWQAIGGEELLYEMSLACLLLPSCDGQPIWNKTEEKGVKALAAQYRAMFKDNPRLSAGLGRQLATWSRGEAPPPPPVVLPDLPAGWDAWTPEMRGENRALKGTAALQAWWSTLSAADKKTLKPKLDGAWKDIAANIPATEPTQESLPV